MSQISFDDLVNGVVPDASDFNSRLNALKNRINNGMEADNIASSAVTEAKISNGAVTTLKVEDNAITLAKLADGTLGGLPYYGTAGAPTELTGNITTTQKFLAQTGDGAASAAPSWVEVTHPVKAWVAFDGTAAGPITPTDALNVTDITDSGTGHYVVNFTTAMANATYVASGMATRDSGGEAMVFEPTSRSTAGLTIKTRVPNTGAADDANPVLVMVAGD